MTCATGTSSPTCALTWASMPLAGASRSTAALSVSIDDEWLALGDGLALGLEPLDDLARVLGHAQRRQDDVRCHVRSFVSRGPTLAL